MSTAPRVPVPAHAWSDGVVDMEVVQSHSWPEVADALQRYAAVLADLPLEPTLRELVRMRSARLTGCTY